ncbi:putative phytosulfokines 6 [Bienertia sinuspersici]
MMHKFLSCSVLFLLICLVAFPTTSARLLVSKQGDHHNDPISRLSSSNFEDKDAIDELMGSEICDNENEECLNRRLISEAHLDYIYTQHQQP